MSNLAIWIYKNLDSGKLPQDKLTLVNTWFPNCDFTAFQILPNSFGDTLIGSTEEAGMIYFGTFKEGYYYLAPMGNK